MANLIITVIAIALVAVASLMGAYYGGSAFLNNTGAADASTVLNEAQQLSGAWQSFLVDNSNQAPDQEGCLTGGAGSACGPNGGNGPQYLANIPNWPAAAGNTPAAKMGVVSFGNPIHYYAVADVGAETNPPTGSNTDPYATACLKIIKAATGNGNWGLGQEYDDPATIVGGGDGNGTFGCLPNGGLNSTLILGTLPAAHHYVMAYKLS